MSEVSAAAPAEPGPALAARLARASLILPLAFAALALAARLLPGVREIDDAYITFRYARNLLAGEGFVYNPGERVLGTTTPVYTLWMAGLSLLFRTGDFPRLALFTNALADALTCLLLVTLGERLSGQRRVGLAAALLWAVAPMSVSFAIGGMETSGFILIMAAAFTLYLAPPGRAARPSADLGVPLLAALAILTRPDAALFVGPLGLDLIARRLYDLVRKRKEGNWNRLALAGAAFLAPVGAWAGFAWRYFGSPLPHSVAAKAVAYRLPPDAALVRLIQHYGTPFFEQLVLGRYWTLAGFVLYLALFTLAGLHFIRRDSRAWPMVFYPLAYFVAFSAANPLIFRWYLAPPLPMYLLGILGGLARIASDLSHTGKRARGKERDTNANPQSSLAASLFQIPNPYSLLFFLPVVFFLYCSLQEWKVHPDHGPDRPAPDMAWHKLELVYEGIGRALAARVTPETTIAAGDVGALGYYSGARILDTVGLMSPEATAYYPLPEAAYATNYAISTDLILDRGPDYVVFLEVYGRNTLLNDPRFAAAYTLFETIPTDIYNSHGMLIYQRRP